MLSLLALVVSVPVAPSPIVSVAPPPPPVIVAPSSPEPPRTLAFDITVRRDGTTLWSGPLRMASFDGASYSQQSDQTVACQSEARGRAMPARFSEKLRVGLRFNGFPRDRIRVTAEWQRLANPDASTEAICAAIGTRTVSIDSEVALTSTKPVVLNGDAGLQILIVPR